MKIVQKFGGTSLGSIERIRHCASLIEREILKGHSVCVVVSAMVGQTNALINLTSSFKHSIDSPFQDVVASTGEIVSSGLLSLALMELGLSSKPLCGWQVPILTDNAWGRARIIDILPKKLDLLMQQKIIPIVTGFQGITLSQDITTLGRGGSDTSAVAIAAALKADQCDIYTDVDGIYSADPRFVPLAFKHERVSYDIALELASLGAKVLHPRCVEMAKRYTIPLKVLSSFTEGSGTYIGKDILMESQTVSSITHSKNMVWGKFTTPLPLFLDLLSKHHITIDMLQFTQSAFSCVFLEDDWIKLAPFLEKTEGFHTNLSRISLVGQGLRSHPQLIQDVLKLVKLESLVAIDLTETRLSFLTSSPQTEILIQTIHDKLIK